MATAALPGFLRSLGAPAAALGVIEGIADGALSVSKLAGGALADRPGIDRRRVAAVGYLTTGVAYGSFGFADSWPSSLWPGQPHGPQEESDQRQEMPSWYPEWESAET